MASGKELVMNALRFREVERVPWVPFTGVHVARLVDMDAESFLKDSDAIVKGVVAAAERYRADGVCSVFDLQVEAEVLGCSLKWARKNPPAVVGHVLENGGDINSLPEFTKDKGRIPLCLEATKKIVSEIGDTTAVFALICGPFTLAMHLAGSSFLTGMIENPDYAKELLAYCSGISMKMSEWYLETGAHAVAVVDPMTSQISPRHFKRFVTPTIEPLVNAVHERGGIITLFCCGNATKNIELMMQCRPDGIAFDEQVDLAMVAGLADKYNVCFEGNMALTTTLLFGSPEECVKEAAERIAIGGKRGYILSPGCDLPFDTPFYNLEAVGNYVQDGVVPEKNSGFLSLEEALKQCADSEEEDDDVKTEDGKIFIEIVTLDSEGCAPCQYMVESVRSVEPLFNGRIIWRETLIKSLSGIRRTQKLGVSTLPTMLINNEVVFDNIVPTKEELCAEINKRLK
ncbi:uroporphyrinogen decarboxylase family protein [Cloacibacillus sp.]|nr:uroporphyrinogen decarboxylase family protein [Cloacibacillus sp.]MCC8057932.1 uroporphyrinogen decarboxylase family protein [Cloacibacillus sp.]